MERPRIRPGVEPRSGSPQATGHTYRCCDAGGCDAAGDYRAPKGRDRLNEHYWFCLEHVREYNRRWDYCAGLSEAEIETMIRTDTLWQRPTWPLGSWADREQALRGRIRREFFSDDGSPDGRGNGRESAETGSRPRRPEGPREQAMRVLDLEPSVSFTQVKARYRALVKLHHPDANGGDKACEERLKRINQAYNTLKSCFGVT